MKRLQAAWRAIKRARCRERHDSPICEVIHRSLRVTACDQTGRKGWATCTDCGTDFRFECCEEGGRQTWEAVD